MIRSLFVIWVLIRSHGMSIQGTLKKGGRRSVKTEFPPIPTGGPPFLLYTSRLDIKLSLNPVLD